MQGPSSRHASDETKSISSAQINHWGWAHTGEPDACHHGKFLLHCDYL